MFDFMVVAGDGNKIRFNNWNSIIEYLDKNSIRIEYSSRIFGYWELSDGGHITRIHS